METNHIEYKREITKFIEKEIIAFLNYKERCIIYIGIEFYKNNFFLMPKVVQ